MRERHGMSLEHELLELEKRFWTGDTEFYRRHLNDECLVAFTQMAGVMSKDAIARHRQGGAALARARSHGRQHAAARRGRRASHIPGQCHARERRALRVT